MRFYQGAYEALHTATKERYAEEQQIFLVQEPSNQFDENAVMVHNGTQKLGSVCSSDAGKIRALLRKWHNDNGGQQDQEDVIVCKIESNYCGMSLQGFKQVLSIKLIPQYRVNERLARKFVDFTAKKTTAPRNFHA